MISSTGPQTSTVATHVMGQSNSMTGNRQTPMVVSQNQSSMANNPQISQALTNMNHNQKVMGNPMSTANNQQPGGQMLNTQPMGVQQQPNQMVPNSIGEPNQQGL